MGKTKICLVLIAAYRKLRIDIFFTAATPASTPSAGYLTKWRKDPVLCGPVNHRSARQDGVSCHALHQSNRAAQKSRFQC